MLTMALLTVVLVGVTASAAAMTALTDSTPPQTTFTPLPGDLTNDSTPTLSFSFDESLMSGYPLCAMDPVDPNLPGAYQACTTGTTYDQPVPLADGLHRLYVIARDAYGNTAAPASYAFHTDTTAPDVAITAPAPGQVVDSATPDVSLAISGGTAECSFDGAPFVACDAQFVAAPLADGAHRLCVRATDPAGNVAQVCVDFSTDALLPAPGAEGPPPAAHKLTAERGGKVKRSRFVVPVSLKLTPPGGSSAATVCRGTITFTLKPRVRGAKTVTRRARLRASGAECVSRARMTLPGRFKGTKATVRARFGGSDALGSFKYAKTIRRL